jgi:hypothetical protein
MGCGHVVHSVSREGTSIWEWIATCENFGSKRWMVGNGNCLFFGALDQVYGDAKMCNET